MKNLLNILMLLCIVACSRSGQKAEDLYQTKSMSDTLLLVNDFDSAHNFYFSYTDLYGDFDCFDRIEKEKRIIAEIPYIELSQNLWNKPLFWLRNGECYHITGENNDIAVFRCENEMAANEAAFFNKLYENKIDLVYSFFHPDWKQIKKELDEDIHHIKAKERYEQKMDYLEEQKPYLSPLFYGLCKDFFKINYLENLFYSYHRNKSEAIEQILLNQKDSIQNDNLFFSKRYKDFCHIYSNFLLISHPLKSDFLKDDYFFTWVSYEKF